MVFSLRRARPINPSALTLANGNRLDLEVSPIKIVKICDDQRADIPYESPPPAVPEKILWSDLVLELLGVSVPCDLGIGIAVANIRA